VEHRQPTHRKATMSDHRGWNYTVTLQGNQAMAQCDRRVGWRRSNAVGAGQRQRRSNATLTAANGITNAGPCGWNR